MVYETPVFWTFRMCLKWDDKQVTSYLCGAWWYAPNTDTHKVERAFRRESPHMLSNCSNEPVRKAHSGKATLPFALCVYVCAGVYGDQQDGCCSGAISFLYWESLASESPLLGLGARIWSWWCWDGRPISQRDPPASASTELGTQTRATTPGLLYWFWELNSGLHDYKAVFPTLATELHWWPIRPTCKERLEIR